MLAKTDLPTVRIATPSEEDDVMAMCRRLHKENGLFTLSEDRVRGYIRRCYTRKGTIVGVIGEPGHLEASTCILLSDMYYTDDWHLAELWNYVEPEHRRGTNNIDALIDFGKKCSDEIGLPLITGIITNRDTVGKVRLYRRKLGNPAGAFFVYNGKWINAAEPSEEDFGRIFEKPKRKTNGNGKTVHEVA